jgi:hypothetical protein
LTAPPAQRARLRRRGFALEYATMAWMVAEAAVAITAGVLASSIALTGFGLDSVIEFFAAIIVIWQLRGQIADQQRETRAVRLIGVTFFALAGYLAAEAIHDLATRARPGQSIPGRAITAAALIVMPGLAIAKRRTGQALGNRTLVTESAETASAPTPPPPPWPASPSTPPSAGGGPTPPPRSSSPRSRSKKASKPGAAGTFIWTPSHDQRPRSLSTFLLRSWLRSLSARNRDLAPAAK